MLLVVITPKSNIQFKAVHYSLRLAEISMHFSRNERSNPQMNSEQATKDTSLVDAGYQDWLTYCKTIATDAKFRGLLNAYFTGHPSEDYAPLAVGAQEILRQVVDGLLEESRPNDASVSCRLKELIYAPESTELR
jgi:hypothetical protein